MQSESNALHSGPFFNEQAAVNDNIATFIEPADSYTLVIAPFTRTYDTAFLIDLFRTCGSIVGFYKPCDKEFIFVQF